MNKITTVLYLLFALITVSFVSCRKDGLNSALAKQIQYRWEKVSSSSQTDYSDGRALTWTVRQIAPGSFLQFDNNGYLYDNAQKFEYKLDGEKILSLAAGIDRFTTPQYTDTTYVKHVDDHLLVLFKQKYFISGAYSQIDRYIDSLKK